MITSMRFSTLSRIVWSQDFDLAKKTPLFFGLSKEVVGCF